MAVCLDCYDMLPTSNGIGRATPRTLLPSPPRRAKTTKGDVGPATPSDDSVGSAKVGPQTLTVTGLKMTLNGVEPLGADSRMTWQGVTRDFIEANVWETQNKVDKLQVNVNFDNQDPPFVSRRRLTTTLLEVDHRFDKRWCESFKSSNSALRLT